MRRCIPFLLLAACSRHASVSPVPAKTAGVTVGDFQYTAKNGGANVWGPLEVQVTVTATNTTDHSATLDVLGGNCAVLIRIFRKSDRSGKPLYDASSGAECYVKPVHERLAPHATYTAQSGRYGPGIDIPSGRYYLSALIIPADREQSRIEVPAGEFVVRR
ncbi:MAG TPA: hypothetical protein VNV25_09950 [Gemmatimonadaceae bacterium]|jgi:hypothetical protein|nr:hypothetical protein [Gemmatimonadaceae bacterium]